RLDECHFFHGGEAFRCEQLRNKNIVTSRKEANRIYYRIRNGKLLELIGTMRAVLCPTNLDDRYDE
ncbi:MAG TPA: transcriptional regulator, partial [Chromatiaceae bacterium]|nr:transcriptional regulator [Chromatiaceae bacterium]